MKSHSVFKYDADLKRWFSCNSIRYGRADFTCLSSMYSSNIYVFGGADGEEQSRIIEKYDSILDIWTILPYKIPISFLSKNNQILMLQTPNDPFNILSFSGSSGLESKTDNII